MRYKAVTLAVYQNNLSFAACGFLFKWWNEPRGDGNRKSQREKDRASLKFLTIISAHGNDRTERVPRNNIYCALAGHKLHLVLTPREIKRHSEDQMEQEYKI